MARVVGVGQVAEWSNAAVLKTALVRPKKPHKPHISDSYRPREARISRILRRFTMAQKPSHLGREMIVKWQPIETAPKDTVVLTDCGTAIFDSDDIPARWFLCHTTGDIPCCNDWGREEAQMEPRLWMPFPDIAQ